LAPIPTDRVKTTTRENPGDLLRVLRVRLRCDMSGSRCTFGEENGEMWPENRGLEKRAHSGKTKSEEERLHVPGAESDS